tara:strand:+ start:289 stop:519 length:231 start_codon:yes stop_codon:yes gene_type:complete
MSKPSSALIKLTDPEIGYVIMALVMAKQASANLGEEYYEKMFDSLLKDFEGIKQQIKQGERELEINNENEKKIRTS